MVQNEWELVSEQYVLNATTWNSVYSAIDNSTRQSDRFVIDVKLKRRATAYNIVFYTPLLGKMYLIKNKILQVYFC